MFPTGGIIGIVIGVVVILCGIIVLVWWLMPFSTTHRRRRRIGDERILKLLMIYLQIV